MRNARDGLGIYTGFCKWSNSLTFLGLARAYCFMMLLFSGSAWADDAYTAADSQDVIINEDVIVALKTQQGATQPFTPPSGSQRANYYDAPAIPPAAPIAARIVMPEA